MHRKNKLLLYPAPLCGKQSKPTPLISNHRKLLWSKAMVVNVAEKLEQDSGRYD
jgi:hypothetical protein